MALHGVDCYCIAWHDMTWHYVAWCDMALHGVAWRWLARHGVECHGIPLNDMTWHHALKGLVLFCKLMHSNEWCYTAWCGIALHRMARYVIGWCCLAWWSWCCMVWHQIALHRLYGVALYIMVWHSMAWFGCIDHSYTLLLRFTFWGASSKSDYLVYDKYSALPHHPLMLCSLASPNTSL